MQYRPYSATGPVKEKPSDLRAVTLFELEDLARIAGQKNKHVILIARQCGACGRTRAEALQPLLTNASLKVFSTQVLMQRQRGICSSRRRQPTEELPCPLAPDQGGEQAHRGKTAQRHIHRLRGCGDVQAPTVQRGDGARREVGEE